MAKNLQEALLEVQEDLRRLGLELKGNSSRKRSKRRRHRKRATLSSSRAAAPQTEQ
jgi:hypothetical protein